jgi:hypothetical protein
MMSSETAIDEALQSLRDSLPHGTINFTLWGVLRRGVASQFTPPGMLFTSRDSITRERLIERGFDEISYIEINCGHGLPKVERRFPPIRLCEVAYEPAAEDRRYLH